MQAIVLSVLIKMSRQVREQILYDDLRPVYKVFFFALNYKAALYLYEWKSWLNGQNNLSL